MLGYVQFTYKDKGIMDKTYPNKKACCLLRAFFVPLRATSCQMLGTSCQRSCQPRHEPKSSCQIVLNIWHFVPNIMPTKAQTQIIVQISHVRANFC